MLALSRERVRLEGEREKKDGQCKRREVGGRGWETEVRGSERGGGEERGEEDLKSCVNSKYKSCFKILNLAYKIVNLALRIKMLK